MALKEVQTPKDMREFLIETLTNIDLNYEVKGIGLGLNELELNARTNSILLNAYYNNPLKDTGVNFETLSTPLIISFEIYAEQADTSDAIERQNNLELLSKKILDTLFENGIDLIDNFAPYGVNTNTGFLNLYLIIGKVYV